LASALARNSATTDEAAACSDNGVRARLSLPASILEWSSTSLRMLISDSPDDAAVFTRRRCCGSSLEPRSSSSAPSTPFIGVRISWLIVARNCDLAMLAASAASLARLSDSLAASALALARCSEALAASTSRPWRTARVVASVTSRAARYMVSAKIADSTASGNERTFSTSEHTAITAPICGTASSRKDWPTSDMK
jgi:hypothetical protein